MKLNHLLIGANAACGRTTGNPEMVAEVKNVTCSACLRSKYVESYIVDNHVFYRLAVSAGELLQAERDEAAYQAHVAKYADAVYIDPEVDYR